jgi:murein DD-endopeptidase MepM/ murein hydrolase activator NlpD
MSVIDWRQAIQVIIIPESGERTYHLKVRRGLIYAAGILSATIVVLFLYMVVIHKSLLSKAMRADRLDRENTVLRTQALKIAELEGELARLSASRKHLFELAGLSEEEMYGGEDQAGDDASAALPPEISMTQAGFEVGDILPATAPFDTAGSQKACMPTLWPVRGWITAEFDEELPGRDRPHRGLDIAAPQGTAILSAAEGVVTLSGWDTNLGLVVVIDHQNGLSTLYGHCSQILVQVGDQVGQGQVIAHLGNTGRSSAPHLHFEIREGGVAVNPRDYLGP